MRKATPLWSPMLSESRPTFATTVWLPAATHGDASVTPQPHIAAGPWEVSTAAAPLWRARSTVIKGRGPTGGESAHGRGWGGPAEHVPVTRRAIYRRLGWNPWRHFLHGPQYSRPRCGLSPSLGLGPSRGRSVAEGSAHGCWRSARMLSQRTDAFPAHGCARRSRGASVPPGARTLRAF